jgi:ATP-binding cassette subfamily F protein 3
MDEALVTKALLEQLPGLAEDGDAQDYFKSLIMDTSGGSAVDEATITETLAPFVESYGLAADTAAAEALCGKLCKRLMELSGLGGTAGGTGGTKAGGGSAGDDGPKLLEKAVVFSDLAKSQISEAEQATLDTLWGFDKIRKTRNEQFEAIDAVSAKDERKAAKEQKRWLEELENKFAGGEEDEEEKNQISSMTLPDLSGTSRERDIHVNNFTMTFGGKILLENAHLRLVYGRRYGLIGVNGVGKTTLLKHMAAFDIEGFPRHHRVLHVKQEVRGCP